MYSVLCYIIHSSLFSIALNLHPVWGSQVERRASQGWDNWSSTGVASSCTTAATSHVYSYEATTAATGAVWPSPQHSSDYMSNTDNEVSKTSGGKSAVFTSIDKPAVTYSGPDISGIQSLPASLSTVIFPSNSAIPMPPNSGSSILGHNALPQIDTNGNSVLGTFDAPTFPPYLGSPNNGSDTSGAPWGNRTANGTNPYTSAPDTGVTRSYNFVIARATMAPDGVERGVIVVNGAFPGPTIEANWGDTIEVTLTNNITGPEEGTALHWHGLLQTNTQYEDGVPGISQCPLPPGETFTYSFKADLYGTSWWHSHFSAQYAGGAVGALIIHGPENVEYDVDLGPVLLTDYYHANYYSIVEDVMGTDLSLVAPESKNNLINGKGVYNCSLLTGNTTCTEYAGLSKFQFTSGKTHRLRLINAGAEGLQRFSVDDHVMQVMAYDFVPIVPYTTDQIVLGVGQRADVLIAANGSSTGSYWMRSTISSSCSLSDQPYGLGIIYYEDSNTTAEPDSTSWDIDDSDCANVALENTVPYYSITPPSTNATVEVALSFTLNSSGNFLWTMDGSSFRTDYNDPILPLLQADNSTANIASFPTEWNVYNFGKNDSFIIVIENETPISHPMHIHGHNMFVLSSGSGSWDGSTQGNSSNPARRDVQILPPDGYIAIQITADNPGVWPLHCHIAWHVSGGLYMNILERPADIPSLVKSPSSFGDLCDAWFTWTSRDTVDQIDSGLRKRTSLAPGELHQAPNHARGPFSRRRHLLEHIRHSL